MTGAHLQAADLSNADVSGCNLFEADFLLAQLWSLSEKKIKSLQQPSLHVLKSLLSYLDTESVSVASKILQYGFGEKRATSR